jgi:hypothetical protein
MTEAEALQAEISRLRSPIWQAARAVLAAAADPVPAVIDV